MNIPIPISDELELPVSRATGGVDLVLHGPEGPESVRGAEGEALLFALKRAGLPLQAICGGKGACGTCRVQIAPAWRTRLEEPARREARLLAFVGAAEGDRLSCRISLTPAFNGLEIHPCADNEGDAP